MYGERVAASGVVARSRLRWGVSSHPRNSMNVQNTRQQILNAAQRLIETGGFLRLTTKEIAREAGYAEGTLFKHFARKEDLCLAVVLENSPKFRETLAKEHPGERSVV